MTSPSKRHYLKADRKRVPITLLQRLPLENLIKGAILHALVCSTMHVSRQTVIYEGLTDYQVAAVSPSFTLVEFRDSLQTTVNECINMTGSMSRPEDPPRQQLNR